MIISPRVISYKLVFIELETTKINKNLCKIVNNENLELQSIELYLTIDLYVNVDDTNSYLILHNSGRLRWSIQNMIIEWLDNINYHTILYEESSIQTTKLSDLNYKFTLNCKYL